MKSYRPTWTHLVRDKILSTPPNSKSCICACRQYCLQKPSLCTQPFLSHPFPHSMTNSVTARSLTCCASIPNPFLPPVLIICIIICQIYMGSTVVNIPCEEWPFLSKRSWKVTIQTKFLWVKVTIWHWVCWKFPKTKEFRGHNPSFGTYFNFGF